jgi:hypothetical protein
MKRLFLLLVVPIAVCASTTFRVDNAGGGPVDTLNLVKDGGLTGHRDAGMVGMLECAVGGTTTRGCIEPGTAQSFSGQKTFGNGTQDTCVAHASLTACSSPNAGLHQCCSTHGNAEVWCNGTSNVELTGSSSYVSFPPLYVNGLLGSHLLILDAWNLPFAYTVTGLSGFVAAGAGTTQTLRFTDGTNNCDCSIDCTAGGTHFTCSGNCSYAASTLVVSSVVSDGCTTPPTAKGLLVPEGYR